MPSQCKNICILYRKHTFLPDAEGDNEKNPFFSATEHILSQWGMKRLFVRPIVGNTIKTGPLPEKDQNHPSALNHAAYYRTYHGAACRLPVWQACHLSEVPGKISGYSDLVFLKNPNSFHSGIVVRVRVSPDISGILDHIMVRWMEKDEISGILHFIF